MGLASLLRHKPVKEEYKLDKITKDDFVTWENNIITKKLFTALQEIRDKQQQNMSNEAIILADDCQKTLVRVLGILEGLDIVLQMDFEDMIDKEEEKVVDEGSTNNEYY